VHKITVLKAAEDIKQLIIVSHISPLLHIWFMTEGSTGHTKQSIVLQVLNKPKPSE
jgi:hypothetical protein